MTDAVEGFGGEVVAVAFGRADGGVLPCDAVGAEQGGELRTQHAVGGSFLRCVSPAISEALLSVGRGKTAPLLFCAVQGQNPLAFFCTRCIKFSLR